MFRDRADAGKKLADLLLQHHLGRCVVYGLPRGGVPVAFQVARLLGKPLDIIIVKKIGAPEDEELALGAVAGNDPPLLYFNRSLMDALGYREENLQSQIRAKQNEILLLREKFQSGKGVTKDIDATAIIVDDGIATGATVKIAIMWLRSIAQKRIVVAVPVAQESVINDILELADEVVCIHPVSVLYSVGEYYGDFSQTSNEEVIMLLKRANRMMKKYPS